MLTVPLMIIAVYMVIYITCDSLMYYLELSKNKVNCTDPHTKLDLAAVTDDCSGCYAIPETAQCVMHSVTTSY